VDNKLLAHVLRVAQLVQQHRDDRRGHSDAPARTNQGQAPANAAAQ
jgi:hypothetical protein